LSVLDVEWPLPFGFVRREEGRRALRFDDRRARLGFGGPGSGGGWPPISGMGWLILSVAISKSASASWGTAMTSCRITGQESANMLPQMLQIVEKTEHTAP